MQDIASTIQTVMANQSVESESTCPNCGENKFIEMMILGKKAILPRMCECERTEYNAKKTLEENKAHQLRLENLIKNSLMDDTFKTQTFENWDFKKGDEKMYKLGTKYADKFTEFEHEGLGLLIHGDPGNGKTFISCCIANRLLQNDIPTICVSINSLLSRIRETYNKWGDEAEADILRGLNRAKLLIIDDLGTENATEWSKKTVYNIIDSRYRSKLPLIITTNLSIDTSKTNGTLADLYGRRTEDRILEMCTPVKNNQKSIRLTEAKKKAERLRDLFG